MTSTARPEAHVGRGVSDHRVVPVTLLCVLTYAITGTWSRSAVFGRLGTVPSPTPHPIEVQVTAEPAGWVFVLILGLGCAAGILARGVRVSEPIDRFVRRSRTTPGRLLGAMTVLTLVVGLVLGVGQFCLTGVLLAHDIVPSVLVNATIHLERL